MITYYSLVQDPRVLDAMLPYLVNYYGNPHSRTHAYGWESEAAMEHARQVSTRTLRSSGVLFGGLWEAFLGNGCISRRDSESSFGV